MSAKLIVISTLILLNSAVHAAEQTITDRATIIDAQTISLRSIVIKLWGIAAPVHDEPGSAVATMMFFRIFDRHIVTCHMPSGWAKHQPVGKCEAAGLDVGAVLVSSGVALDCPATSGGHYEIHEQRAKERSLVLLFGYHRPTGCDHAAH